MRAEKSVRSEVRHSRYVRLGAWCDEATLLSRINSPRPSALRLLRKAPLSNLFNYRSLSSVRKMLPNRWENYVLLEYEMLLEQLA